MWWIWTCMLIFFFLLEMRQDYSRPFVLPLVHSKTQKLFSKTLNSVFKPTFLFIDFYRSSQLVICMVCAVFYTKFLYFQIVLIMLIWIVCVLEITVGKVSVHMKRFYSRKFSSPGRSSKVNPVNPVKREFCGAYEKRTLLCLVIMTAQLYLPKSVLAILNERRIMTRNSTGS